jgi:hypothetical protein
MLKNKFKAAIQSTLVVSNMQSFDKHTWKAFQSILKQIKDKPELIDEALEESPTEKPENSKQ